MSFEKWIEEKLPNQNAWDRCKNLKKASGISMPELQDVARSIIIENLYPQDDIMDIIEAQANYSKISKDEPLLN